jgi:hypothetical protein
MHQATFFSPSQSNRIFSLRTVIRLRSPWTGCHDLYSFVFMVVLSSVLTLRRRNTSYGFNGTAIQWFRSYLTGRSQYVRRGSVKSSIVRLVCGVPQGSVLGPILFVLYTADLIHLIERHSLHPYLYADDTQVYDSCSPADVRQLQSRLIVR